MMRNKQENFAGLALMISERGHRLFTTGLSVLVPLPTGVETLIADYLIEEAVKKRVVTRRPFPTRNLRSWEWHGEEKIGIITGDVVISRKRI